MNAWWLKPVLAASTLAQLQDSFAAIVGKAGFRHFIYRGRFPRLRTGAHEVSFDNCPEEWRAWYRSSGLDGNTDPLRRRALLQVTPILWREAARHHGEPFTSSRRYGLATGVTHPVRGPDGQCSAISFIKNRGGAQAEREIQLVLADCQLLSHYMHEAVARIIRRRLDATLTKQRGSPQEWGLSERECECLMLTASGKTAPEIAEILPISERTVIFHLANVRKKLGAANSRHAVSKAISLGLIAT